MEEETMFLFVIYSLIEISYKTNKETGKETRIFDCAFKRTCMQRGPISTGDIEKVKRVEVSFDPLLNTHCYVIVMFVNKEEGGIVFENQPKFPKICLSIDEAEKTKQEIENGQWKEYRSKGETFQSVKIYPSLVTKD